MKRVLNPMWEWVKAFGRKLFRRPKTFGQQAKEKKNRTWGTGNHSQRLRGARSKKRAAKKRHKRIQKIHARR